MTRLRGGSVRALLAAVDRTGMALVCSSRFASNGCTEYTVHICADLLCELRLYTKGGHAMTRLKPCYLLGIVRSKEEKEEKDKEREEIHPSIHPSMAKEKVKKEGAVEVCKKGKRGLRQDMGSSSSGPHPFRARDKTVCFHMPLNIHPQVDYLSYL